MSEIEDWPTELRLSNAGRVLTVAFDSGTRHELAAEYLRVTSPSAEVQGHSAVERQTVGGKRDVRIVGVTPVGNYAVKLSFDDGHDTGLYTWRYLRELGAEREVRWPAYLAELAAKGLSRGGAP